MPFCLKPRDTSSDLAGARSVLIVPCRFCPAASLSIRERQPYVAPFRSFLRTPAYESYIRALRSRLAGTGRRADLFDSAWPHQFVMCMWTSARRKHLARCAASYDAALVLGCDAAVDVVRKCTASTPCRTIAGMEVEGIMNVTPTVRLPFNVSLEVTGLTRVLRYDSGVSPASTQMNESAGGRGFTRR